jgi:hypothetical protein
VGQVNQSRHRRDGLHLSHGVAREQSPRDATASRRARLDAGPQGSLTSTLW